VAKIQRIFDGMVQKIEIHFKIISPPQPLSALISLKWLGNCIIHLTNIFTMKSRIFKTLIAILAPIVIEYVVKKISEKLDKKEEDKGKGPKQITA
jgi:hypothetical protein